MKHFVTIGFFLSVFSLSYSQSETLPSGSYIINMGVTSQSVSNGLKPYGLIFEMLKTYQIPVKWVIGTGKLKDSADFTYNGKQFKGGTFIIPRNYVSGAARTRIYYWRNQGVVIDSTVSSSALTVDVTKTLTSVPKWALNSTNTSLSTSILSAAGIPSTSYATTSAASLGACDDIFMMPHADPTWTNHGNLYNWNRNYKGSIWAGCHSVSVLESVVNPSNSAQQLNFLSTTGLINYNSHNDGSTPYKYFFNRSSYNGAAISARPDDPVFQMMGVEDGAHTNGSEQIFIPLSGGAWRNTTKIGCYDSTQSNVSSFPNGPAAVTLYGRGFGLNTAGLVMYQGGHDISGTGSQNVAAMRQFLNFSLYAMADKVPVVSASTMPGTLVANTAYTYSVTASSPVNSRLSYQWTSSCGGTFSNATSASTSFTPAHVYSDTVCTVSCIITDSCSRYSFVTKPITVLSVLPVNLVYFNATLVNSQKEVDLSWGTASEQNLSHFDVMRSMNGKGFETIAAVKALGNTTTYTEYGYTDREVAALKPGPLYYKLRMVDFTTAAISTDAIQIDRARTGGGIVAMYPNPAGNLLHVELNAVFNNQVTVEIMDLFGRTVYTNANPEMGGGKLLSLDIEAIPSGIYLLNIKNSNGSVSTARFIKK